MSATSAVIVATAMSSFGLVVIEPPASFGADVGERIVESCNRALGEGRCELGVEPTPEPLPEPAPDGTLQPTPAPSVPASPGASKAPFRARLRWDGSTLQVELSANGTPSPIAESTVRFSASDDEKQRWVAAGLLVASLVAAQAPESAPPAAPAPEPEPPPPAPPPPAPPSVTDEVRDEKPARLRVDLGALIAPGLDEGPLRKGLALRAAFLPPRLTFGPTVSLRAAHAPADALGAELDSATLSLGLVGALTPVEAPLSLEVSAEGTAERALVRVSRAGATEEKDAWRFGARLGLTAAAKISDVAGIWVGADVTGQRPELVVRIDSKAAGTETWLRWAALAGLRLVVPGS